LFCSIWNLRDDDDYDDGVEERKKEEVPVLTVYSVWMLVDALSLLGSNSGF